MTDKSTAGIDLDSLTLWDANIPMGYMQECADGEYVKLADVRDLLARRAKPSVTEADERELKEWFNDAIVSYFSHDPDRGDNVMWASTDDIWLFVCAALASPAVSQKDGAAVEGITISEWENMPWARPPAATTVSPSERCMACFGVGIDTDPPEPGRDDTCRACDGEGRVPAPSRDAADQQSDTDKRAPYSDPEFMRFWRADHRPAINNILSISHVAVNYIWQAGRRAALARAPLADDDTVHRLHKLREEVAIMYQMLDDCEWAEHIAVTPEGQCLETAITKLVGKANAARAPLPDSQEAVLKFAIEVEKMLCAALGREWATSGISIESLIKELATRAPLPAKGNAKPVAKVIQGTEWGPGLAFIADGQDSPKVGTLLYAAAPAQAGDALDVVRENLILLSRKNVGGSWMRSDAEIVRQALAAMSASQDKKPESK